MLHSCRRHEYPRQSALGPAETSTPSPIRASADKVRSLSSRLLVSIVVASLLSLGTMPGKDRQASAQTSASRRPNVVWIVLDTVRADALSCYGNPRPLTPRLDQLATESLLFENAHASAPWTLPSHASMFTGLYSAGHRATQETLALPREPATLAAILEHAGYRTVGASTNAILNRQSGLQRGFGEFYEVFRDRVRSKLLEAGMHPHQVLLKKILERAEDGAPFFAFFNFIEAHTPYAPPPEYRRAWVTETSTASIQQAMRVRNRTHYLGQPIDEGQLEIRHQLYEGEVAHLDAIVGEMIDMLAESGHLDDTLLIVTSDHGENFGEHGLVGHNFCLYETLLHVPLILRPPDGGGGTIRTDPADLVDLFATVLAAAGVEGHPSSGRDLLAPGAADHEGPIFAEYYYPRQVFGAFTKKELQDHGVLLLPFMRRLRSVQSGPLKLIWSSDGAHEMYDLARDPHELHDLLAENGSSEREGEMIALVDSLVDRYAGGRPLAPVPPVGWAVPGLEEKLKADPELLEKLRALGYVD
jgi:arylsulfatase A-like enzyme